MLSLTRASKLEMDDLLMVDPFSENRAKLRIRRSGSWYNISYIDINENPLYNYTLICAHGWGSSSIIYSYLLKLLRPYFRIIAYDMKGHGFSDIEPDTYDLGLFTEELAQIVDHINPKNLILLGHSMGSAIIQNYLCLNPERAKAAVVLSSASNFREPIPRLFPLMFSRMDERVKNLLLHLGMNLLESSSVHPKYLNMIREQRKSMPYHVFRQSLLNTVYAWKKDEELKKLETPILLMVGEKDYFTSVKDSMKLRELLPNSRLVILPDSKHDILLEHGKDVANLVKEFVEYQIDLESVR